MSTSESESSPYSNALVARRYAPFIIVEIGSSAARVAVIQPDPYGNWKQLGIARKRINIARGALISKPLFNEMRYWLVDTIQSAHKTFNTNSSDVTMFSTAAFREPLYADKYRELLQDLTGFELQIIDGRTEAELAWIGACHTAPENPDNFAKQVVLDIGGRSTEVGIGTINGELSDRKSFDTGHFDPDPDSRPRAALQEFTTQHSDAERVLLTAGSGKLVVLAASVLNKNPLRTDGELSYQEVIYLQLKISTMNPTQIEALISSGLAGSTESRDLISGVDAVENLLRNFENPEVHVVKGGVRTGFIQSTLQERMAQRKFGYPQLHQHLREVPRLLAHNGPSNERRL